MYSGILNKISPHRFFLIAALLFGVIYNILTPPLQAPDEQDHFKRVYQISEGNFLPQKKDNRLGGEMPVSFKEFYVPLRLTATNLKYTLNKEAYKKYFSVRFHSEKKEFDDFPNTSYYSPVSYLPQALGVFVAKHFAITNAQLYYAGRIAIYFIWVICLYFIIRMIPVYKWLFTALALLPMHVYISNSFSADPVSNILSFLFLSLILKYTYDNVEFNRKHLLILTLIGVLLALSKIVYVGLILSFFIIPAKKFTDKRHRYYSFLILFGVSFLFAISWSLVVRHYFIHYFDYNPAFRDFCCISHCANYYEQKAYILAHPLYFPKVIFNSLFSHPQTYLIGYIGNFGNSDAPLPAVIIILSFILILIISINERPDKALTVSQKIVLTSASFFSFVLLLLSQHLTWDCVGEGIVDIVQGRYLIPLFPPLFLLLTGIIKTSSIKPALPVIILVVLGNIFSFRVIYNRYSHESFIGKTEFTCGMEEITSNGFIKTSNPEIQLEGINSRNDSISRNGKYSAMLSPASPYCFTYRFKGLRYGDLIEISAWQKGEGAQMIIAGKGKRCGEFYYPNLNISFTDENGWKRMHYAFTFNLKCDVGDSTETTFFMWNPGKSCTYVDDIEFSIKKFDKNYLDEGIPLY